MKIFKLLSVISIFALCLLFSGCRAANTPEIEDYTWKLTSVQSGEKQGQVIAYGKGTENVWENASEISMELKAADGKAYLTNTETGEVYSGEYSVYDKSPGSVTYTVSLEDKQGMAVCAMTTYNDGSRKPSFIINAGDYVLNFYSE